MVFVRILSLIVAFLISSATLALEPDQIFEKVSPSVVIVFGQTVNEGEIARGSGVVIAPGEIVTNCHVIKDAVVIGVKREQFVSLAELRFSDPDRDLCQIRAIEKQGFDQPIPGIVSVSELKVGQRVFAIGAPQGLELTLSDGLISSLRHFDDEIVIQTNAPVSQGSSGGGLFNSNGRLIGLTTFIYKKGQNLNFAIPASWIFELSSRHADREENGKRKAAREAQSRAQLAEQRQREAEEMQQRAETEIRPTTDQLVANFVTRIQAKIRGRVVLPPDIEGNPQAVYEVVLLPGGDVLEARLTRSSGNAAYDAAVGRAIMAAQPLPLPSDPNLFQSSFRVLELRFQPW